MKKLHKIIICFISVVFVMMFNVSSVEAASLFSVSGSTSVSANASFSVTITTGNCTGEFTVSTSAGSGGGSYVISNNSSKTVTITAPSSGDFVVTVTPTDVYELVSGGPRVTTSQTLKVSVKSSSASSGSNSGTDTSTGSGSDSSSSNSNSSTEEEDAKSSDNKLSSLTVSEGSLSPSFSSGTTSYSVSVVDVSSIKISASASDSKATVSGTGTKDLELGNNSFSVVVTAENGSKKTYTVKVYLDETPTVFADLGEQELGVVKNTTTAPLVENAETTTVTLAGEEIPAWNVTNLDITIVYMVDADGNMGYYIYEGGEITSLFTQAAILGRNVAILDIPEEDQTRAGLVFQEVTVDGVTLDGWVFEDATFADYAIINVMNDMGSMVDYLYCVSENDMILSPNMATVTSETLDALYEDLEVESVKLDSAESEYQAMSVELETTKSYLIVAVGAAVALLIAMIALLIVGKKRKNAYQNLIEPLDSDEDLDEDLDEYLDEEMDESAIDMDVPLLEIEEATEIYDIEDEDVDSVVSDWDNEEK